MKAMGERGGHSGEVCVCVGGGGGGAGDLEEGWVEVGGGGGVGHIYGQRQLEMKAGW